MFLIFISNKYIGIQHQAWKKVVGSAGHAPIKNKLPRDLLQDKREVDARKVCGKTMRKWMQMTKASMIVDVLPSATCS